jgi:cation:H+ antiporter
MTPLIAGLTVVAFGTSSPEMVVSVTASLNGSGDIALGNVIGSNIFNIALILGLTALIVPLKVESQLLKFDTPFMIGTSLLFLALFHDRQIVLWEAVLFFICLVVYIFLNVRMAKRQTTPRVDAEYAEELAAKATVHQEPMWKMAGLIILGLAVLIAGSKAFVQGAVDIARSFHVSEAIIGLTIVAAGTSLPELASSLVAAFRNQADIAIGNIIGSNIFNILGILGVSGMVAGPLNGPGMTQTDLAAMTIVAVALWPMLAIGRNINRFEGGLLLAGYGAYLFLIWPKG